MNRLDNRVNLNLKKQSKFEQFTSRLYPKLRKLDVYGEPVKIHIDGEETYKTHVGGVCSILHILVTAVVVLLALRRVNVP